jgi:WD40 repeat protein
LRPVSSPPDASAIATFAQTDNSSLLTGDSFGRVHRTELRTGRPQGSPLQVDQRAVLAICQLPGKSLAARFAVAGGSGAVTIITILPDGELEAGPVLRGAGSPIRALCSTACPGGQVRLAAAGNEGTIWLWDLTSLHASTPPGSPLPLPAGSLLAGHKSQIWSLADLPARPAEPPLLASAGGDNTVRLWDQVTGRALGQSLTGHADQVRAVTAAISNDGCVVLVSGGQDGTIRLWHPVTGEPHAVIPLGLGVHALLQQRPDAAALERTGGGATITVGLSTGILALDLHRDLFEPRRT